MRSLDRARDAIDLVAATVGALGFVEQAIFDIDFVNGLAPTSGVVFTEDLLKITGQQGTALVVKTRRMVPRLMIRSGWIRARCREEIAVSYSISRATGF